MKRNRIIGLTTLLLILGCAFGAYYLTAQAPVDLYDEVTQHQSAYERQVRVRAALPVEKIKLWNRQLDYALAHETLTPEERTAIEGSRSLLTVQAFKHEVYIDQQIETDLAATFLANNHIDLYRRTFIIPGNSTPSDNVTCKAKYDRLHPNIISSIFRHTSFAFFQGGGDPIDLEGRPECNCNFAAGCDSWSCGGTNCTGGYNCGPFGEFWCYYTCL